MPRKLPPHLTIERTRHGTAVQYVRIGKGARIRIREAFDTPEFWEAYRAAIAGVPRPAANASAKPGTMKWLIRRYMASGEWAALARATRYQREQFLKGIEETAGDKPFAAVTRKTIVEGRDRRKDTPFAANNWLKTVRALFAWAVEHEHIEINPAATVKKFPPPKGHRGFHTWTLDEVAKYEARWPLGTRERLALDLLLYTGLRRGDIVRFGRQHVRGNMAWMPTEKTGKAASFPILPPLQASIDASVTGDLTFFVTAYGRPMTKESFGNWFRDACVAAGVPGRAHGLRKAGATLAAEGGATEAMLNAIYGWADGSDESRTYVKDANRQKLSAEGAAALLRGRNGNTAARTSQSGAGKAAKT